MTNKKKMPYGLYMMIAGILLVASPLYLPLSLGWYAPCAVCFHVYSQVPPEGEWAGDYHLKGAVINIEKTDDSQVDPVNIWGKFPPTATDEYGLMTFYTGLGVQHWKVSYMGKYVEGYVELTQTGREGEVSITIYFKDGVVVYRPPEAEYVHDEPPPLPPDPVPSTITVCVDSEPVKGYAIAVHGTKGTVLRQGTVPFQFTVEGQFPLVVMWHGVEGYIAPNTFEGVISKDTLIMGTYEIPTPADPDPPPVDPDPDPIDPEPVEPDPDPPDPPPVEPPPSETPVIFTYLQYAGAAVFGVGLIQVATAKKKRR